MDKIGHGQNAPASDIRISQFLSLDTRFAVLSVSARPAEHLPELTAAERDVVSLAVQGASNRQIAGQRQTSQRTVANQMAAIFRKLGVGSRAELILRTQCQDRPSTRRSPRHSTK
jgi:DNA-binding NarL/FixJ family response regulator